MAELHHVEYDETDEELRNFCKEKIANCRLLDVMQRVFGVDDIAEQEKLRREFKKIQEPLYLIKGKTVSHQIIVHYCFLFDFFLFFSFSFLFLFDLLNLE